MVIEVFDTGIGIKKEKMSGLFQIFGKLEDEGELNHEGTGLGLYLCEKLVKQF